ncbi:MAG: tRNA (adenosine(37)-N6)-dimethylallyltransferase MiaA [Candidatus Auribacterota bacterium]
MSSSGNISKENKTIFIVGTTATGKTDIAHQLALRIGNAEIISADSMQVYRNMPVLTAMPEENKRTEVIYHLLDYVDITQQYSVADYYRDAVDCIKNIHAQQKIPIVVGGTGMYVRSLLYGIFESPPADTAFRSEMQEIVEKKGCEALFHILLQQDPVAAQSIEPRNVRRVIRALEVFRHTGKRLSELQLNWHQELNGYHPQFGRLVLWGISRPRPLLYQRINFRVDTMLKEGLLEEVSFLLSNGIEHNSTAYQALGIREMRDYFSGTLTLDGAIELLKRNTRRFAKRQLTWFAREKDFSWYVVTKDSAIPKIIDNMLTLI